MTREKGSGCVASANRGHGRRRRGVRSHNATSFVRFVVSGEGIGDVHSPLTIHYLWSVRRMQAVRWSVRRMQADRPRLLAPLLSTAIGSGRGGAVERSSTVQPSHRRIGDIPRRVASADRRRAAEKKAWQWWLFLALFYCNQNAMR